MATESCGQGLAEHAALPAKMAELLKALADNLDAHVPTIDARDPAGRKERGAYSELSSAYASISDRLADVAERMRGYRELAPAPHHQKALADPHLLEAFGRFVRTQEELLELLGGALERDRAMLREAGGDVGAEVS